MRIATIAMMFIMGCSHGNVQQDNRMHGRIQQQATMIQRPNGEPEIHMSITAEQFF
jgi:hypothetical protein